MADNLINSIKWKAIFNVKRCKIALLRSSYGKKHIKQHD
jgi:hypothetical protein